MRIFHDRSLAWHDRWTEVERDVWNCAGKPRPNRKEWRHIIAGGVAEAVEMCPLCNPDEWMEGAHEIYHLFLLWRQFGIMPEAGGSLDQTEIVMRAFSIFESERSRIAKYRRDNP